MVPSERSMMPSSAATAQHMGTDMGEETDVLIHDTHMPGKFWHAPSQIKSNL